MSVHVSPATWARLRGLALRTRLSTTDAGHGLHAGRQRGAGMEFAQYRAYEHGDDLRLVDWKLHARTDRYFVREATRDAPLAVWLLIDCTASMAQADTARPAWRKFDAARLLAACVGELALQQGDRYGFYGVGGGGIQLDAQAGAGHRHRFRLGLEALACDSPACTPQALAAWTARLPAQSLVIALTDGYDDALVAWLGQLAALRRQVAMVQIAGADERDFAYTGVQRFRDPESGAEVIADARSVRSDFLARHRAAQAALAGRCAAARIAHTLHALDEPIDAPLRRLFGRVAAR